MKTASFWYSLQLSLQVQSYNIQGFQGFSRCVEALDNNCTVNYKYMHFYARVKVLEKVYSNSVDFFMLIVANPSVGECCGKEEQQNTTLTI